MEPAETQFVEWMREQFRLHPELSQSDLARHLNIHRNIVSKMLKGQRKRGITVSERQAIEQFFGASVASPAIRLATLKGGIAVKGRISPTIWAVEDAESIAKPVTVGTPALDFPADEQSAYVIDTTSADGEFRAADYVYAVPFAAYRSRLLPGDIVVTAKRRHGLVNYSLARAVRSQKAIALSAVFDDGPASVDDVIALVIGTYRPIIRRA